MTRRSPLALFAALLAAPLGAQVVDDPAALVRELADPATRPAAQRRLVALGDKAVPALIEALGGADDAVVVASAATLQAIGPAAGAAVQALYDVIERAEPNGTRLEVCAALAELVPWRPQALEVDDRSLSVAFVRLRATGDDPAVQATTYRLYTRGQFPRDAEVPRLMQFAGGHFALQAELAVELLGHRGAAARTATPLLGTLLRRPDPRILTTSSTVPVRSKAARAILAIAPDSEFASAARAVLEGSLAPEPLPTPLVPERARARATAVVAELAHEEARAAAAANLVALGRIAVPPLLDALRTGQQPETLDAALGVLRDLGPAAVEAVPTLADLLLALPARHTTAVVAALTTTAPWGHDVLLLSRSADAGSMTILGHTIAGPMSIEQHNEIDMALHELEAALAVEVTSSAPQLESLLAEGSLLQREVALRIVRARGAAMRSLQASLAALLDNPQPRYIHYEWLANGSVHPTQIERDEIVHRLAAEAILAVVDDADPLVGRAKAVLSARGSAPTPAPRRR